jgi:hypothetical protein
MTSGIAVSYHRTQRQPQRRRPRYHQQTQRRRRRRGPTTTTCAFSRRSVAFSAFNLSTGSASAAFGGARLKPTVAMAVTPTAVTTAPGKIFLSRVRRSIPAIFLLPGFTFRSASSSRNEIRRSWPAQKHSPALSCCANKHIERRNDLKSKIRHRRLLFAA